MLTRFGSHGAWLHRLARGEDTRPAVSRRPPLELDQRVVFEPALETIEPIVFSTRQTAERCVAELARHGLVCTEVRIEVVTEGGWTGARIWAHSRWFAAADLIDRLYWQLQGDPAPEPVCEVRLLPEAVESLADHGEGLWGSALDEHVERGIARLQGMLGPEEVLAPALQGGRSPRDRQQLSPWGERRTDDPRPAAALAGEHPAAGAGPGVRRAASGRGAGRATGGRWRSRPRACSALRRRWSAVDGAAPMRDRGLGRALADRRAVVGPGPGPAGGPVPGGRGGRQRLAADGGGRPVVDRGPL